jgi:hypothetical protein
MSGVSPPLAPQLQRSSNQIAFHLYLDGYCCSVDKPTNGQPLGVLTLPA